MAASNFGLPSFINRNVKIYFHIDVNQGMQMLIKQTYLETVCLEFGKRSSAPFNNYLNSSKTAGSKFATLLWH